MPNFEPSTREMVSYIGYGLRCDASPASIVTGQNHIFRVSGRIWMIDLIGIVTTVLQTAALTLHWDVDADVGGDVALNVTSADLTGSAVGLMLELPAAVGGNLTIPAAGAYLKLFPAIGWVISASYLDLHASADRTGVIKWSVFYYPLEDGASVSAV